MGVFRQKINFLETKENKIPMDRLLKVYKILPKVIRKLDQMIVKIKNTVLNLTFFNYNKKPIYKNTHHKTRPMNIALFTKLWPRHDHSFQLEKTISLV